MAEISKIGSKNSNMLENASQHIACDFDVSQALWTSHRRCMASQRVAGRIDTSIGL